MSSADDILQKIRDACAEYEAAMREVEELVNKRQHPTSSGFCAVEAKRTTADEEAELIHTIAVRRSEIRKIEAETKLREIGCSFLDAATELLIAGDLESARELHDFVKNMHEKYGGKEEWESMEKAARAMIDSMGAESTLAFCLEHLNIAPSTLEEVLAAADGGSKDVAAEENGGNADANASGEEEGAPDNTAR